MPLFDWIKLLLRIIYTLYIFIYTIGRLFNVNKTILFLLGYLGLIGAIIDFYNLPIERKKDYIKIFLIIMIILFSLSYFMVKFGNYLANINLIM